MKTKDFLTWLDSFLNFEKKQQKGIFWLESMKFLCGRLGNPQDKIPCIHIAGSKGKGSTSKMIACIIHKAGFSCGLYTSPHIDDFRERIGTSEGFFEDYVYETAADELYSCVSSVRTDELPGGRQFTWFELVTAFAFLCFRIADVDYAVYETGLGGRLDSTNIVVPLVSVLTSIELEHTDFLGDTIEKIAGEKSGIIKPGIPVVAGVQRYKKAEEIFRKTAEKNNSVYKNVYNIIYNLSAVNKKNGLMSVKFSCREFQKSVSTQLRLVGDVQAWNAATAAVAARTAVPSITEDEIEEGLSEAFLPGRFEIRKVPGKYRKMKGLVLDGAHTVNSISGTIDTLRKVFPEDGTVFDLLFACAADKDIKDIAPLFKDRFRNITITRPGTVRASDLENVEKYFSDNGMSFSVFQECQKASEEALKKASSEKNVLLVTGSFYLLAEMDKYLSTQ